MVARDDAVVFWIIAIMGTLNWYVIGSIPGARQKSNVREGISWSYAIFTFFMVIIAALLSVSSFMEDFHEGVLSASALVQYLLVGMLCAGAILSALYSLKPVGNS
jgi:hypothetical protein